MRVPARSASFWLKCVLASSLGLVLLIAFAAPASHAQPQATTINVNSTLDEPLQFPTNGQCMSTPSGQYTLRAAKSDK